MSTARPLSENFAPYASYKSVTQVIKRYRERGLPDPLTPEALQQVGVTASMASPTYRALLFLGLVDDAGAKTATFEKIRRATSDDYRPVLADAIRNAYADVFVVADPGKDNETAIADAFRGCDPANQRDKMVRLFIGLCEESGISQPRSKRRSRVLPMQARSEKTPVTTVNETVISKSDETSDFDFRLVSAIVQQLPRNGPWTSEKRQKWIDAMTSAVDLLIEVQEKPGLDDIKDLLS